MPREKGARSDQQESVGTSSDAEGLTFAGLASEYEKILSENHYGSVGWILLHSKIQKCYCSCSSENQCTNSRKSKKQ